MKPSATTSPKTIQGSIFGSCDHEWESGDIIDRVNDEVIRIFMCKHCGKETDFSEELNFNLP